MNYKIVALRRLLQGRFCCAKESHSAFLTASKPQLVFLAKNIHFFSRKSVDDVGFLHQAILVSRSSRGILYHCCNVKTRMSCHHLQCHVNDVLPTWKLSCCTTLLGAFRRCF